MRYIHHIFSYQLSKRRRCPVVCLHVILPRILVAWRHLQVFITKQNVSKFIHSGFLGTEVSSRFCGGTVEPPSSRGTYRICVAVCEPRAGACSDLSQHSDSPRAPALCARHVSSPCLVAACSVPSSGLWCALSASSSCWSVSKGCLQSCTARWVCVPVGGAPHGKC